MKKLLAVAALVAAPTLAQAEFVASVEAFYSKSEIGSVDSDGYGLRGRVNLLGTGTFVRAQYLDESIDGGGDYTETRIGGGFSSSLTPLVDVSLELEYAEFDSGSKIDGFGAFVGVETNLPIIGVYGRAGYLRLDDKTDGTEFNLGARVGVLPFLSLFAEYRNLELKASGGGKTDIDGYRIGARLSF